MALKADLRNQDWQEVYGDQTNQSYHAFYTHFGFLSSSFPTERTQRESTKEGKPRFIEGLEKDWKKKNRLYREFITEQRIRRTRTKI